MSPSNLFFWSGVFLTGTSIVSAQLDNANARDMFFAGLKKSSAQQAARKTPAKKAPELPAPAVAPPRPTSEVNVAKYEPAPLGIRYTVVDPKGRELPADSVFRSGDQIRLTVEVNDSGHLYIVHQGSSGNWQLMFPSHDTGFANSVAPGRKYVLPPDSVFTFIGQPGVEKLFLVLSRTPELALDELIDAIRGGRPGASGTTLVASAKPIENALVDRLRTSYSRDLIVQKIKDDQTKTAESAVYVVNPTGKADSRVVADIHLVHR
jgi:hypothetical protein